VWWGNEPFHTINLAEEGLLQPYESAAAEDVVARFRDPQHRWTGNGLRARVIGVSGLHARARFGLQDFVEPGSKGVIAMARPTAGTTGGHVAALYVLWGEASADDFFRKLRANDIKLLGGNGPVAEAVGRGQFRLGLTDNDDVASAAREGGNILLVLPDQESLGTLMVPTTVALVAGTKRADDAKKLIDYLASAQVEQKLIDAKFCGWSVRGKPDVKAMDVDYPQVARALPAAVRRATAILEGREDAPSPSPSGIGPG
jgi:iron(III) transport system substrate-binding protein